MTSQQLVGGLRAVAALAEAIRELGSVPAGELYAAVMPAGVSLEAFEQMVGILERAELVRSAGHVLHWIGQTLTAEKSGAQHSGRGDPEKKSN